MAVALNFFGRGLLLLALLAGAPSAAALHTLAPAADLAALPVESPVERLLRAVADEEAALEAAAVAAAPGVSVSAPEPMLPDLPAVEVPVAPLPALGALRPADPAFTCVSTEPLTVRLQDLSDPGDGRILLWKWDFGDGTVAVAHTSSDNPAEHRYAAAGTYTIGLTIRAADGLRAVAMRPCEVLPPVVEAAVLVAPPAPPAAPPGGPAGPSGDAQGSLITLPATGPAAVAPRPAARLVPAIPPAPDAPVAAAPTVAVATPEQGVLVAVLAAGAALALVGAQVGGARLARLLRFLPLLGLFTRLKDDELLEHPVRLQIMETVKAEPGIHYQAIVRALEKGNGVLEHHLRMLVQGGLVKERHASGYTCYFPSATDRRVMDAHAVLKSDVARRVLETLVQRPGDPIGMVARSVGVTPKAVTYHLSRFQEAGLVRLEKVGRTVQAYANPLALQVQGVAVAG